MLIFYGKRAKILGGKPITKSCESCGQNSQQIVVAQKYFHIFWIPIFPFKKTLFQECENCKLVVEETFLRDKAQVSEFKKSFGTPVYMFSGIALVLVLFSYGRYQDYVDRKHTAEYLKDPKIGDIYIVQKGKFLTIDNDVDGKNKYYLLQVSEVNESKIIFKLSSYEYQGISGAKKGIEKGMLSGEYPTAPFGISRDNLNQQSGITSIKR